MKVLHVSDTEDAGGADVVFHDTIKVCEELGFDNIKFVSDKKINAFSYIFSIRYYMMMKKLLSKHCPEIIHIHCYYHYLTPSILLAIKEYKKNNDLKVIFTAHDYHLICPNSGLQKFNKNIRENLPSTHRNFGVRTKFDHRGSIYSLLKLSQRLVNYKILKLYKLIDIIISPSVFLKETFENYDVKIPIVVIRKKVNIKRDINYSDLLSPKSTNALKIIIAARLEPEKGIFEFINEINIEDIGCVTVDIYGEGSEKERINSIKLKKNISVNFMGKVKRDVLTKNLPAYHLFCLPSIWYENAPISIIEAASAGLPILVPNYGGLKEMAENTTTYRTYEPKSGQLITILNEMRCGSFNNEIIDPNEFSYEKYKESIKKLYSSKLDDAYN